MCFTVYCISIHPSPYAGTFSDLFYPLFKENLFLSQLIVRKMSAAKSLPLLHCYECHRSYSWPFDRICKKKKKTMSQTLFRYTELPAAVCWKTFINNIGPKIGFAIQGVLGLTKLHTDYMLNHSGYRDLTLSLLIES